tara:strand:+ start:697 stop:855 length:159 start_codon:yes stop_codon:yes gene_type:complete
MASGLCDARDDARYTIDGDVEDIKQGLADDTDDIYVPRALRALRGLTDADRC